MPIIMAPAAQLPREPTATTRLQRQSSRGSIGSRIARSCRNSRIRAPRPAARTMAVTVPGRRPPCTRTRIRPLAAIKVRRAPIQSMERDFLAIFSRRKNPIIAMETRPIGMFTQNTTDQETCWIRKAPREGPTTAETPKTEETRPWIWARSDGV